MRLSKRWSAQILNGYPSSNRLLESDVNHEGAFEYASAPLNSFLVLISNPPYFAIQLWPGAPNTQGGPRRNEKAQVVDTKGMPIPRLYSAGELGSIFGMLYPSGGGNLAECITFGRIAGI